MIPELRDLSYESRLLQCGFTIVNGYEVIGRNMFFKLKGGSRTRGHKAALSIHTGYSQSGSVNYGKSYPYS